MKRTILGFVILVIVAGVLGCGKDEKYTMPDKPTPPPSGKSDSPGGGKGGSIKE